MNPIVKILMERDEMSFEEATEMVEVFADEYNEPDSDVFELEQEFTDTFGLEPEYLFELLDFMNLSK